MNTQTFETSTFKSSFEKFRPRAAYLIGMVYIASIFYAKGFYFNYGINISDYIGFTDILFSFFADILFFCVFSVVVWILLFFAIYREKKENNDRRITIFIRTIIVFFLIVVAAAFFLNYYWIKVGAFFYFCFIVVLIASLLYINPTITGQIDHLWLDEKHDMSKKIIGWGSFLGGAVIFCDLIPFLLGFVSKEIHRSHFFNFTLNDNTVISSTPQNRYQYIGGSEKYFFLYDTQIKRSLIIPKGNLKYWEVDADPYKFQ